MQSAANSYYYVEVDRGVGTRDNEGGMGGKAEGDGAGCGSHAKAKAGEE